MDPSHRAAPGRHRRTRSRHRQGRSRAGTLPTLLAAVVLVTGGVAIGTLESETPVATEVGAPMSAPPAADPAAEGEPPATPDGTSPGVEATDDAAPPPAPTVPPTVLEPDPAAPDGGDLEPDDVPQSGDGTFRVARLPDGRRTAPAATWTYTVEVEQGLPFEVAETAAFVDEVLGDPRGWTGRGEGDFARVGSGSRIRVLVASPDTTDRLCAPLRTNGQVSCRNGDLVVLNARRWAFGTDDYAGRLRMYRTYLVNHEVGHALGYGHVPCPGPGQPAPVMLQQTYGLDGCARNPWPIVG